MNYPYGIIWDGEHIGSPPPFPKLGGVWGETVSELIQKIKTVRVPFSPKIFFCFFLRFGKKEEAFYFPIPSINLANNLTPYPLAPYG